MPGFSKVLGTEPQLMMKQNFQTSATEPNLSAKVDRKSKSLDFANNHIQKSKFIPFSNKGSILDNYILGKELGKGGFSSVFAAKSKELGEERAIKAIKKQADSPINYELELSILKELDHPNIIKIYEVFENKDSIYIVQE